MTQWRDNGFRLHASSFLSTLDDGQPPFRLSYRVLRDLSAGEDGELAAFFLDHVLRCSDGVVRLFPQWIFSLSFDEFKQLTSIADDVRRRTVHALTSPVSKHAHGLQAWTLCRSTDGRLGSSLVLTERADLFISTWEASNKNGARRYRVCVPLRSLAFQLFNCCDRASADGGGDALPEFAIAEEERLTRQLER